MLLDPHGETARRYHARWLPRAYVLDEEGRLAYVQPATTLDPQAPLQVAALWGENRRPAPATKSASGVRRLAGVRAAPARAMGPAAVHRPVGAGEREAER